MFVLVRLKSFRRFLGQLGSSVLENAGFISNQLLMVYFFGMTGPGAITANNYAMRIGMLGFGILTIPISQLTQSRLCTATSVEARRATVHPTTDNYGSGHWERGRHLVSFSGKMSAAWSTCAVNFLRRNCSSW